MPANLTTETLTLRRADLPVGADSRLSNLGASAVAECEGVQRTERRRRNSTYRLRRRTDRLGDGTGTTIRIGNRGVDEHKSALRVAAGSDQSPDIYFMWAGLGLGGECVEAGSACRSKILPAVRLA
jgi:hypothetical protein